jgi:hypothetical protein
VAKERARRTQSKIDRLHAAIRGRGVAEATIARRRAVFCTCGINKMSGAFRCSTYAGMFHDRKEEVLFRPSAAYDGECCVNVSVYFENPCSNKYEQTSSFPNGV